MPKKTILFLGPLPPPLNGQSYAFQKLLEYFSNEHHILINQNLQHFSSFIKFWKTLLIILRYLRIFVFESVEVVYISGSRSSLGAIKDVVAIYLFGLKKCRIVMHIHASGFDHYIDGLPWGVKGIFIRAYTKVHHFIILVPDMIKEYLRWVLPEKISVVSNFYDLKPRRHGFWNKDKNRKFRIVYFSNLLYSKGIFDLITAFHFVSRSTDQFELIVAGEFGSDSIMNASDVEEKFYECLKQNPNISYKGFVYGEDKAKLLSEADVFCLPSFYSSEAVPISMIEAMACGCVIVCTDHHYLTELITPLSGFCVQAKSPVEISEKLMYLYHHPIEIQKMGQYNMHLAAEQYSISAHVSSIKKIIES